LLLLLWSRSVPSGEYQEDTVFLVNDIIIIIAIIVIIIVVIIIIITLMMWMWR